MFWAKSPSQGRPVRRPVFFEPGTFSNLPSFISTSTVLTPVSSPCSLPKSTAHTDRPWVFTLHFSGFFVTVVHRKIFGRWPGLFGSRSLRLGKQLEIHQALRRVARCADAVCAGVTAANHNHILVLRGNVVAVLQVGVSRLLVFALKKSMAKCTPLSFAVDGQISGTVAPVVSRTMSCWF